MTEEDLIRERDLAMKALSDSKSGTSAVPSALDASIAHPSDSVSEDSELVGFYKAYLSKYSHAPLRIRNEWKIIDELGQLMLDVDSRWQAVGDDLNSIENEKSAMLEELSELNGKSSSLLAEQAVLEKTVYEMESRMHIARTVKDVGTVTSNRDILVLDFDKFANVVDSVEKSLVYLGGSMSPLNRQFEHLRFQLCALGISVGVSAIESYSSRLSQFVDQQSSITTNLLFSKFIETLAVVSKIANLFHAIHSIYMEAVVQLAKKFEEEREKILTKIIRAYMQKISSPLVSVSVRKSVNFVSSLAEQEAVLFRSIFPLPGHMPHWLSVALYAPLRTLVISSDNLADLRECAEVIRLELLPDHESSSLILCKLHRDIQERLIFKTALHQSSVEDLLKNLTLLSGVVDSQTLHELAHEVVRTASFGATTSMEEKLVLIDQLLRLREQLILIDCEYNVRAKVPLGGIKDQFLKLVGKEKKEIPQNQEIVEQLLQTTCEEFNAIAVAEARGGNIDRVTTALKSSLTLPGLEAILLRPAIDVLRAEGAVETAATLEEKISTPY